MKVRTDTHDSPLGTWRISLGEPPPALAGLATAFWDVAGRANFSVESMLPSAHLEILFNLGDSPAILDPSTGERTAYREVWVSGLQERPLLIETSGFQHIVGVRLTPIGAWRVLGLPLTELTGQVVDLDLVLGNSLLVLREQLGELGDPVARLRRLAVFVHRRLITGPGVHPAVLFANHQFARAELPPSVREVVTATGVSHRHLVRKFEQQVGVAPKRMLRLLRFSRAVDAIKADPSQRLAYLAADLGFSDQAHLNREFRLLAGTSPGTFASAFVPDEITATMVER